MIKINIISVGKIKEKYLKSGIDEFSKRLSKYCKLEIIELNDEKAPDNLSQREMEIIKDREGASILSKIKQNQYVLALSIDGEKMTSEQFAKKIESLGIDGSSNVAFIIGGSLGLSKSILSRADMRMSFSDMTFPHQMMRLILLEQIYRCFRINNNEPYHK